MSVFGGDSWGRDSQQRKRRVDELMLPASGSSSPSTADSFKRLPSHALRVRHMAAESRLREKELSRQHEINKRLAVFSDATLSNSSNPRAGAMPRVIKEKPLIEQTRRAILEAQSTRLNNFSANTAPRDQERMINDPASDSHVSTGVFMTALNANTRSIEGSREALAGNQSKGNVVSEWQVDFKKRHEQELRFTALGWKWDCHGKWYRDENVEFDSDDDDPNICLR